MQDGVRSQPIKERRKVRSQGHPDILKRILRFIDMLAANFAVRRQEPLWMDPVLFWLFVCQMV